ncbi:MAG: hypothetical protein NW226_13225 [Microscillaceae bacterium]|nr:hypothetical protein [Microscillaceae bacterium]
MFRLKLVFYPIVLFSLTACVEKKISKEEKQTLITASDVLDVYEFNIKNKRSFLNLYPNYTQIEVICLIFLID